MELVQDNANQNFLSIPIAFILLVMVGAILLFTFGFKSAEQPPFGKLTNEDRKLAGKKRKNKEKKTTVSSGIPSADLKNDKDIKKSLGKNSTEVKQEKKADSKDLEINRKSGNNVKIKEDVKIRKIMNKLPAKPVDFDEGNWKTVPTKFEKKKKVEHSPDKKEKKILKKEKEEMEKNIQNIFNEGLKVIEIKTSQTVTEPTNIDTEIIIIEPKLEGNTKEQTPKKEISDQISGQFEEEIALDNCPDMSPVEDMCHVANILEINETTVVFDELGDVWTGPRVTKKSSKKKARRDN